MRSTLTSPWFLTGQIVFGVLIASALLIIPAIVRADSDSETLPAKNSALSAIPTPGIIKVDREAAHQMGIRVERVSRQRFAIGFKATGQIEALPDQKVVVTTPILGTVVRLLVKPNDPVEAGQVVALVSSPELAQLRVEAAQKRDEATAGLEQARADLKLAQQNYTRQRQQAIADLNQAQTQVALAQERYDRNRELQTAGAGTRRQVQESEAELAAAHATLTKAQSKLGELEAANQLTRAQAGVSVAQSRLRLSDGTYRARLQQLKTPANREGLVAVTAPIAGTVADRPITPGETVTVEAGSKPLMTIVNAKRVWATANVHEKDLAKVAVGESVRVTVASLPKHTFTGRVAQIGTVVEGTRVVPVKVELENPQQTLKPGLFAELEILTERSPVFVLAIPSTAIVDNDGISKVFVQQGEGYRAVEVTLGQTSGPWVEVKNGLKAGDRIVTAGATLLYAQSLGSAGIPTDDDDKQEAGKKSEQDLDDAIRGLQIPIWLGLPITVAIAGGTFWIGRRTQKQSRSVSEAQSTQQKHPTFDLPPGFDGIPFAGVKPKPNSDNSTIDPATKKSQQD